MLKHNHQGINSQKIKKKDIVGDVYDGSDALNTYATQTVEGIKTLGSIPILPATDASGVNQMLRKKQVDDVSIPAYGVVADDSNLVDSADDVIDIDHEQTTPVKEKDINFNDEDGTITVKFDLKDGNGAGGCFGQIYINGVAEGILQEETGGVWETFEEDIDVTTGDNVQLYLSYDNSGGGNGGQARNFRLYYKTRITEITTGTINLD